MAIEKVSLVSGKIKTTPATSADAGRSSFIDLQNAEPNLGVPATNGYILSGNTDGTRSWIAPGSAVASGYTGSVGYAGSLGYSGSLGYTGSIGFTGSAGFTGSTGFTGSVGFAGSLGYAGSVGYTGSKGDTGYAGSFGYTGSKGDIGYTGSVGYTGSGYSGSGGATGYTGSTPDITPYTYGIPLVSNGDIFTANLTVNTSFVGKMAIIKNIGANSTSFYIAIPPDKNEEIFLKGTMFSFWVTNSSANLYFICSNTTSNGASAQIINAVTGEVRITDANVDITPTTITNDGILVKPGAIVTLSKVFSNSTLSAWSLNGTRM